MKKTICCILAGIMLSFTGSMNLILAQPKDDLPPRDSQSQEPPEKCKPSHDKGPECKPPKKGKQQPPPPQQHKPDERQPKDKQPPPDTNNGANPPQNQPPQH